MREKLRELGLSGNEISVYLTLLRLGSASAGKITEHSGVHRRNVYDALERLSRKGLAGFSVREGVKYFSAASPMNLLQIIEEQKKTLKSREDGLGPVISELLTVHRNPRKKSNITIYRGVKGIKTVFEDILSTGKENLVLGAHRPPGIIANYLSNFHKRRVKAGIRDRMIFNNDFARAKELAGLPRTEVRLMPKRQEKTTCINIYGDKVAILTWSDPVSIVIESREIADNFRHYFNTLWKAL